MRQFTPEGTKHSEGSPPGDHRRARVLIVAGTFLPGVRGGGHIRSIASIIETLGSQFDFHLLCGDRDFGETRPYPDIRPYEWTKVGQAHVMYLPPGQLTVRRYRAVLRDLRPHVIYLNTAFSIREFVIPAILARVCAPRIPVVVAPRGCLDPGALSLKSTKKRCFLRALRLSRLPDMLTWQASTASEARFIRQALGDVPVAIASNIPSPIPRTIWQPVTKVPGELRLIFFSRIAEKKQLHYLLERLKVVHGRIDLTVAGPVEDTQYWARCEQIVRSQLPHLRMTLLGTIPHPDVHRVLASHHFFALPTLGENFGHAILEALDAGVGVLVSDRTPWTHLAELGAGWDIPLEDPRAWEQTLQHCVDMENATFRILSRAAREARAAVIDDATIRAANYALFDRISTLGESS